MSHNKKIGNKGEDLAESYFIKLGYEIIARNWRYGNWEIDIIAFKNNILHIIEVKTRTSNTYGTPEESITVKKFRFLQNAAEQFLEQHPNFSKIQFDILSISILPNQPIEYFFIEDYFLS